MPPRQEFRVTMYVMCGRAHARLMRSASALRPPCSGEPPPRVVNASVRSKSRKTPCGCSRSASTRASSPSPRSSRHSAFGARVRVADRALARVGAELGGARAASAVRAATFVARARLALAADAAVHPRLLVLRDQRRGAARTPPRAAAPQRHERFGGGAARGARAGVRACPARAPRARSRPVRRAGCSAATHVQRARAGRQCVSPPAPHSPRAALSEMRIIPPSSHLLSSLISALTKNKAEMPVPTIVTRTDPVGFKNNMAPEIQAQRAWLHMRQPKTFCQFSLA